MRRGIARRCWAKAHLDLHLDPLLRLPENRLAAERSFGPWRGFEHVELATHGPLGGHHYAAWLWDHHPAEAAGFGAVLTAAGGGETGAPEVKHDPVRREHYHTDRVAEHTMAWLRSLSEAEPFFCWMSSPDPHHPFDPPYEEVKKRGDLRDRPPPPGHPGSPERIWEILSKKPRHWLDWYEGRHRNPEGGAGALRAVTGLSRPAPRDRPRRDDLHRLRAQHARSGGALSAL